MRNHEYLVALAIYGHNDLEGAASVEGAISMGFLIAPAASDLCIAHNLWPLPTMKSWVEVEGYITPRTEIDIETEISNKSMIKNHQILQL